MKLEELANTELEKTVLSNALLDEHARLKIVTELHEEDFYRETHKPLFKVLQAMAIHGQCVDVPLLTQELKKRGLLEKIGGIPFLANIAALSPTVANTSDHIETLKDLSARRQLVGYLQILQGKAADLQTSSHDIRGLYQAARGLIGKPVEVRAEHLKPIKDVFLDVFAELNEEVNNPDSKRNGVKTGLIDLDTHVGSLKPSELYVIAGKTGNGKSALALTIAINAAKAGKEVLYCGLEMSNSETVKRAVARAARVDGKAIYNPSLLTPENWQKIASCGERLTSLPLFLDDSTVLAPLDVKRKATELKQVTGKAVDLIVIDYLQLMNAGMRKENRVQEVGYITRSLKNLAGELDCPILLLSQLNRNSDHENRAPRLADLRESGTIEQDANGVIFVSRDLVRVRDSNGKERIENMSTATLDIAKWRNSAPNKKIKLFYRAELYYFRDYTPKDEPPATPLNRREAKAAHDITSV